MIGKSKLPSLDLVDSTENTLKVSPSTLPQLPDVDELDELQDDTEFEEIDDDMYEFPEEVEETVEDISTRILPETSQDTQSILEDIEKPPIDNVLTDTPETENIDKKNKKIIPIGAKREKIRAKDFDGRSNVLAKAKILRIFVLLIIVIMFAIGIKNTFFMTKPYSIEEIQYFAKQSVRDFGFPLERGKEFSKEFLKHYFKSTYDNLSRQLLQNYYLKDAHIRSTVKEDKQVLLDEPILISSYQMGDKIGWYYFRVLVSDIEGQAIDERSALKAYWLEFLVSAYYDSENDILGIMTESPVLVSMAKNTNKITLPELKPIGTEIKDESLLKIINPLVDGFIVGYSKSTLEDYSEVKQFVGENPNPRVIRGFGGEIMIEIDKEKSISKTVYLNEEHKVEVDVTVNWIHSLNKGKVYKSRYIIKLKKITDDKFVVDDFYPYLPQFSK